MAKINLPAIEKRWQKRWEKAQLYLVKDKVAGKENFYHLVMLPYTSGDLHIGHWYNFGPSDTYARFKRMQGFNVLSPIGFDAFGLPAENAAIKRNVSPVSWTMQNIENMRKQLKSIGSIYDWSREIITCQTDYYKWTQWMFLQIFENGLAEKRKTWANWCPEDKTVLANEQVVDGHCERCGAEVVQREIDQWVFKITNYAQRLLDDLDKLDWPERTKTAQRNWIGRSDGAEIIFPLDRKANYVFLHAYKGSPKEDFWPWLKDRLEQSGAKVYAPQLPNPQKPNIEEQVNFALKNYKFNQNTVVIAHSLGAVLALKLVPQLTSKISRLVIVAPPLKPEFLDGKKRLPVEQATDWQFDFAAVKAKADSITVIKDTHDDIVLPSHPVEIAEKLNAKLVETQAPTPHFNNSKEALSILQEVSLGIKVFTTRPDTIFGATYLVLAPEHSLLKNTALGMTNQEEVQNYINQALKKTPLQRQAEQKEKTGVELKGAKAINPANKEEIPIWVADYVLGEYGTGAIMAVPAHDERDFAFAKKFKLPIKQVIVSHGSVAGYYDEETNQWRPQEYSDEWNDHYANYGKLIDSGRFSGMTSQEVIPQIGKEFGQVQTQYKIRDWIVSRQRYWGAPIPIVDCPKCGLVGVPEKELPVLLPDLKDFRPADDGRSPLAKVPDFVNTTCPQCKGPATRETDTMDTFVDSSWYYLRYTDPHNDKRFADAKKMQAWLPVDIYIGGAEHTVLHLLYSRFFTKVLYDLKYTNFSEPFTKLRHQGTILGPDSQKMSKSRGNVIAPDPLVKQYGADVVRMFLGFLGPYDQGGPWSPGAINGVARFAEKLYRVVTKGMKKPNTPSDELINFLHKTIKKVGEDLEELKFNTAISALMILVNKLQEQPADKKTYETLVKLLAPFAPHLAEELWSKLGHKTSIHNETFPTFDLALIQEENVTIIVQVNGKLRGKLIAHIGLSQEEAVALAKQDANIAEWFKSGSKKTIFVPNKLINFVV